ncbi:SRPBCC family protein [Mesorhizobium sp. 1M-11]|uniref:SRPBCC family protein n=1 Tax=Mesorhizobium sp. 1M-11 TaxID=1529006 RepID=UPI0009EC3702|nr:SRPBCC family protein [Mesorhizobium sp. 1M-11]
MTLKDTISIDIDLGTEPREAFLHFTREMTNWWPKDYSWSGETLQEMTIADQAGGFCTEIGPHGFRCDFGRVLEIDLPRHIVFTWQIGPNREPVPDPSKAGEVDVTFSAIPGGTRVTLTHRGFSNHGASAEQYMEAMGSAQGWPLILQHFAKSAPQRDKISRQSDPSLCVSSTKHL